MEEPLMPRFALYIALANRSPCSFGSSFHFTWAGKSAYEVN
jgi:hypothetical protein